VYIKTNAADVLAEELNGVEDCSIIIGTVNDPYQKAEEQYLVTRRLLVTIRRYKIPCHILTKSPLVLRDLDLLSTMKCRVTISILSLNSEITKVFEPGLSQSIHRFQIIQTLGKHGIQAGIALIPVLPYLTGNELENMIKEAKKWNAQYLLYKHLELKGDQKDIFIKTLEQEYPHLLQKYEQLYKDSYTPHQKTISTLTKQINEYCKKYNLPTAIPQ
jgi:DNA repair photolyase